LSGKKAHQWDYGLGQITRKTPLFFHKEKKHWFYFQVEVEKKWIETESQKQSGCMTQ